MLLKRTLEALELIVELVGVKESEEDFFVALALSKKILSPLTP